MEYEVIDKSGKQKQLTMTRATFQEQVEVATACAMLSRERMEQGRGCYSSVNVLQRPDDFFGNALTFERNEQGNGMLDICYNGYNAKAIGAVGANIEEVLMTERPNDELAVDGESLDVGTYLSGSDRCFWRESDRKEKRAQIHIVFSSNATADHGADAFLTHGGALVALANILEQDYDVKVSGYFTNGGVFGGGGCQVFEIKDYSEAMDCARLGAVTHPSWFRRIGFAMFESLGEYVGDERIRSGYGYSLTDKEREQVIKDDHFAEWCRIDEDEIVLDFPAPSRKWFKKGPAKAAEWLSNEISKTKVKVTSGEKHIKMWSIS